MILFDCVLFIHVDILLDLGSVSLGCAIPTGCSTSPWFNPGPYVSSRKVSCFTCCTIGSTDLKYITVLFIGSVEIAAAAANVIVVIFFCCLVDKVRTPVA
jgi:hypothetical protein